MKGLVYLKPRVGMDLAHRDLDGKLEGWSVLPSDIQESPILGHSVRSVDGLITDKVVGVDRRTNRILTMDNCVYELGEPDTEWASIHENCLRHISWSKEKRQRT